MKLKDLIEQYGEYDVEEWFEKGTDGVADEKGIKLKKPKPKSAWDLQEGDEYFLITTYGTSMRKFAVGKSDNVYVKNGNVRLTEEEATQEIERRKVETLLLMHGGRRWFKQGVENWVLYLDKHNQATRCIAERPHQGMIYFDSHYQAVKACEEIGNKRIVNALFEVR